MTVSSEDRIRHNPGQADQVLEVGSRLAGAPSSNLIETAFRAELNDQLPLFEALCQVDLAHTLVLAENGIIPRRDAVALLEALHQLEKRPDDFRPDPARGDLYTNREAWLSALTSAASWLGAGRARREAITTAYLIKLREGLVGLNRALSEFVQTLMLRSEEYARSLMPDYTYLQQAQPTSFGHYLLGFAYPAIRDLQRIEALYQRLNQSPAGCGSSNGSRIPQSRQRLARLLGFDGVVSHARDAMWQADLPIELMAMLTAILINLDRLAEDLQIFASDEFALIEVDDCHARASKIMPQKKNPFALTYVRGQANNLIGALTASAVIGRTPSGQPDNRLSLYGTVPAALGDTSSSMALMSEVVALLKFNSDHARSRLDHGFAMASDLAEALVLDCGVPFREAHRLVGNLVRNHLPNGSLAGLGVGEIADASQALLGRRIELSEAALRQALDPRAALASRSQQGGASPESIAEMIDQCRQTSRQAGVWREQCETRLQTACDALKCGVRGVLSATGRS